MPLEDTGWDKSSVFHSFGNITSTDNMGDKKFVVSPRLVVSNTVLEGRHRMKLTTELSVGVFPFLGHITGNNSIG